ncbi:MAG: ABC-2 family transporter protein [Candidatus Micrarchaeota archaeon]|nr:ABC-2 family transporter protein [Candidatus Micrarchaeota archaeon]
MQSKLYIGGYLAWAKILIKDRLVYKMNLALMMIFQIMSPIVMLFVWTAIYLASGVSAINNFTLAQIISYFFIVSAMNALAPNIAHSMSDDVTYGNVFGALIKPIHYVGGVLAYALGNIVVDSLIGIPIIILVTVLMHVSLSAYSWLLFFFAVVLMLALTSMVEFMVGCLSFFFVDIGGVSTIFTFLIQFLSGGLIPLNLLPSKVAAVTGALPFQFMLYTPSAIFTGTLTSSQAVGSMEIGVLWALVFLVLCLAVWKIVRKQIDSVGV